MKSIIFTTSEGHLSIAQSLEAFLTEHKFETKLIFRKEAGLRYYQLVYQRAPALFKPVYELSKTAIADFVSKIYLSKEHNDFIENTFAEENPEYVFNTSFGFNNSIVKMQTQRSFTFINVIPNPRTFFLQDVAKADVTCVFDDFIQQEVQQLIPDRKVIKTGWFVRPAFEKEYDKPAVRAELGFDQKKLLFLLVSGSEGTEAILALAKKLRGLNNVELAIACGNNQGLLEKINSLAEKSEPSIKAIPFTTEIHKYMQAADLVIGKAGPNMVFEAIATGTPFFATTHISGLEDGNLAIIRDYEIGFVEENPIAAAQKINELATNPELLSELQPNVNRLAKYNKMQRKNLLKYLTT